MGEVLVRPRFPVQGSPLLMHEQWTLSQLDLGMNAGSGTAKELPGLISFRMDWLDLLAVQGTLKSLLHEGPPLAKQRL